MLLAPGVGAEATGPLKYRLADAGRHVEFRDVAPQPGAVLPDQVRAVVQQAHALLDGERQSVGVGVQERGELRRDRFPAEHRGHQLRGRRGVQGPWFHPDATGLCDQPPQQRPGPYLLGPVGQDESRGALPLGPQQQQEFHGRFVGPVRVLHHEQLDTEGVDEFDERAEQTAPGRRGVGQRVAGGGNCSAHSGKTGRSTPAGAVSGTSTRPSVAWRTASTTGASVYGSRNGGHTATNALSRRRSSSSWISRVFPIPASPETMTGPARSSSARSIRDRSRSRPTRRGTARSGPHAGASALSSALVSAFVSARWGHCAGHAGNGGRVASLPGTTHYRPPAAYRASGAPVTAHGNVLPTGAR